MYGYVRLLCFSEVESDAFGASVVDLSALEVQAVKKAIVVKR